MGLKKHQISVFVLLSLLAVAIRASATEALNSAKDGAERPDTWAVVVQKAGVPNCFRVVDVLYRGAQPTREGFTALKKMGIKTVVSLREFHSDEKLLEGTGLNYYRVPINTMNPNIKDYQKVLDIINNSRLHPVFIHCLHGADRTGTVVALYRILVQGWEKEEAIRELKEGGYGYHSIHKEIIKFIRNYPGRP